MKEKVCRVAMNFDSPRPLDESYKLPNGDEIKLTTKEVYMCGELLFKPYLCGFNTEVGLHQMIYNCLMKCDIDVRQDLVHNIQLCGGVASMPGLVERLQRFG